MPKSDAVSSTVSSLQSAYNLTKNIANLNEAHTVKVQIGELQTQILAAQADALASQEREFALSRRVNELEQKIAELEAWDREATRYELTELPPGVFVYTLKETERGSEPSYKLCPNCFQERRKRILQGDEPNNGITRFHCLSCKAEIRTGHWRPPQIDGGFHGGGIAGY